MGFFGFLFNMYKSTPTNNEPKKTDNNNTIIDKTKKTEYAFLRKLYVTDMNKENQYDFIKTIDRGCFKGLEENEINDLSSLCKEQIGIELPEDYKKFLKISNGFLAYGVSVLGKLKDEMQKDRPRPIDKTFDIIEWHKSWEYEDEYLILGQDSLSYMAYDITNNKYVLLNNGTLDVLVESNYFSVILEYSLKENQVIKE